MKTKQEIRKTIRLLKSEYSPALKKQLSATILTHLEEEPHFQNATTVLLYHSLPDEVQTADFIQKWVAKKRILLPKVEGDTLTLHRYTGPESLSLGAFGIYEPNNEVFQEWQEIDVAVVPGVAFTENGYRVGRGKGFYDRLLPALRRLHIYIIGVAFPFQIFDELPSEPHDVTMDAVLFK